MDISDQQMKQLAAGAPTHSFSPSNYMHAVDSFSSHFPNYNILQPSLILNSSNFNEMSSLSIASDTATASTSSPHIMFNPGNNMNMASIGAGLDQIPGLFKATYDYSYNQIYTDQAHMYSIAGVDPHDNLQSVRKSMDHNQEQKPGKVPADPSSATKAALPLSGGLGAAFASQEASHKDAHRPVEYSTRKIVKPEPDVDQFVTSSSLMSNFSGYPSASSTGTSFFHSLGDIEPFKEETYFDERRSAFDHIDAVASTSSSALDHHHHHHQFFDFSSLPSFSVKDASTSMITSHQSSTNNSVHGMNEKKSSSNNKASCTHVGTDATTSTPTRCKTQPVAPKRRKSQQKRVVCVPATGGLDRPTGECLPSDSWAWRKYGQKPIKNSPYPRSYYKCSSVKGCTARKQVERNPSDPLIIIITYTVEHSHPNAAVAPDQPNPKGAHEEEEDDDDDDADKQNSHIEKRTMISAEGNMDAVSEESCEPISSEGTYHDINNEENMMIESGHDLDDHQFEGQARALHQIDDNIDENQRVSSMLEEGLVESRATGGVTRAVGLLPSSSHNHLAILKKTLSSHDYAKGKAEEDVFSQLDELPDLFGSNEAWPHDSADQGGMNITPSTHINIDPFDLYYWP